MIICKIITILNKKLCKNNKDMYIFSSLEIYNIIHIKKNINIALTFLIFIMQSQSIISAKHKLL